MMSCNSSQVIMHAADKSLFNISIWFKILQYVQIVLVDSGSDNFFRHFRQVFDSFNICFDRQELRDAKFLLNAKTLADRWSMKSHGQGLGLKFYLGLKVNLGQSSESSAKVFCWVSSFSELIFIVWALLIRPHLFRLICGFCHTFWTNYDLDLFSTSKWPSELQFYEKY